MTSPRTHDRGWPRSGGWRPRGRPPWPMAQLLESDAPAAARVLDVPPAARSPRRTGYKRPFDLTIIALSLVLGFPVWLLIGTLVPLAVWLTDRGPVFYTQTRVGMKGRIFRIIKFRTMVVGAESDTGPVWASEQDGRVTRVGRLLRATHLDEAPQLINILRGEMSLVGPRPERPELLEAFCEKMPEFRLRLRVKPGIAGLAQTQGLYHMPPRKKLRYDNLYIETLSPWLDLQLLAGAVRAVLFRRNR